MPSELHLPQSPFEAVAAAAAVEGCIECRNGVDNCFGWFAATDNNNGLSAAATTSTRLSTAKILVEQISGALLHNPLYLLANQAFEEAALFHKSPTAAGTVPLPPPPSPPPPLPLSPCESSSPIYPAGSVRLGSLSNLTAWGSGTSRTAVILSAEDAVISLMLRAATRLGLPQLLLGTDDIRAAGAAASSAVAAEAAARRSGRVQRAFTLGALPPRADARPSPPLPPVAYPPGSGRRRATSHFHLRRNNLDDNVAVPLAAVQTTAAGAAVSRGAAISYDAGIAAGAAAAGAAAPRVTFRHLSGVAEPGVCISLAPAAVGGPSTPSRDTDPASKVPSSSPSLSPSPSPSSLSSPSAAAMIPSSRCNGPVSGTAAKGGSTGACSCKGRCRAMSLPSQPLQGAAALLDKARATSFNFGRPLPHASPTLRHGGLGGNIAAPFSSYAIAAAAAAAGGYPRSAAGLWTGANGRLPSRVDAVAAVAGGGVGLWSPLPNPFAGIMTQSALVTQLGERWNGLLDGKTVNGVAIRQPSLPLLAPARRLESGMAVLLSPRTHDAVDSGSGSPSADSGSPLSRSASLGAVLRERSRAMAAVAAVTASVALAAAAVAENGRREERDAVAGSGEGGEAAEGDGNKGDVHAPQADPYFIDAIVQKLKGLALDSVAEECPGAFTE